jgi:hypothetical protein
VSTGWVCCGDDAGARRYAAHDTSLGDTDRLLLLLINVNGV